MIFYSYHDGETEHWFSSKLEATKEARDHANWCGEPIDIKWQLIKQKPTASLVLSIINQKGFVDATEIVATVKPARGSRGLKVREARTANVAELGTWE